MKQKAFLLFFFGCFSLLPVQAALNINAGRSVGGGVLAAPGDGPLGANAAYQSYAIPHEDPATGGAGVRIEYPGTTFDDANCDDNVYAPGVTVTWPDTADQNVRQAWGRANDASFVDFHDSWIGSDSRTGNGGNGNGLPTTMRLSFDALPPNTPFTLTTYHFDSNDQTGEFTTSITGATTFDIGADPDDGTAGNGLPDPLLTSYTWMITSDAAGNASIDFISLGGPNAQNQFFVINGFDLVAECPIDPPFDFDDFPPDVMSCLGQPGNPFGMPTVTGACDTVSITSMDEVIINGCTIEVDRVWTAIDVCGTTVMQTQMIFLINADPPEITVPPNVTICDGVVDDTMFTNGLAVAAGCSMVTNFSFTSTVNVFPCFELITRTFTAQDACDNTVTASQVITNQLLAGSQLSFAFFPADQDLCVPTGTPVPPLVLPSVNDFNACGFTLSSNIVTSTLGCTTIVERAFTATGPCGNFISQTQTITLVDNSPPTITPPANVTGCGLTVTDADFLTGLVVTPGCSAVTNSSFTSTTNVSPCFEEIVRTFNAEDECGNMVFAMQFITNFSIAASAPVFTNFPADFVFCGPSGMVPFAPPMLAGPCPVDLTTNDIITVLGCTVRVERFFTATDRCGNSTSQTLTVDVIAETDGPVIVPPPDESGCFGVVTDSMFTNGLTAVDGCSGTTNLSFTAVTNVIDCFEEIVRTFTAVDFCGNVSTGSQTIVNFLDVLPVVVCVPSLTIPSPPTPGPRTISFTNLVVSVGGGMAMPPSTNVVYAENFNNGGTLGSMSGVSVASNADWAWDNFTGPPMAEFAEINGFGADVASEDWLISPQLNLASFSSASLCFRNARNFGGPMPNDGLSVLISQNYDPAVNIDPNTATWTDVTAMGTYSGGSFNYVTSAPIPVTLGPTVSVAFKYVSSGTGPGDGALWQIDDIEVKAVSPATSAGDCGIVATNISETVFQCSDVGTTNVTVEFINSCGSITSCVIPVVIEPCDMPEITLSKTVALGNQPASACPGVDNLSILIADDVTYCFEVENTGNTVLTNGFLNDISLGFSIPLPLLNPGDIVTNIFFVPSASNALVNTADVQAVGTFGVMVSDTDIASIAIVSCQVVIVCPPDMIIDCLDDMNPTNTGGFATSTATCFTAGDAGMPLGPRIWINEIHYNNAGTDVGEFIEIMGTAGFPINGNVQIELYDDLGNNYSFFAPTNTIIPDVNGCGFGSIVVEVPGIQDGPADGFALVTTASGGSNTVVNFLSTEGTTTAINGSANGLTSTDIGVFESGNDPIGLSLQLVGTGQQYSDFMWAPPMDESPGTENMGQTLICTSTGIGASTNTTCAPPTVDFTDDTTVFPGCAGGVFALIERVWTAEVNCVPGVTATCTQMITVVNTNPPAIELVSAVTNFGCVATQPSVPTNLFAFQNIHSISNVCGTTAFSMSATPVVTNGCDFSYTNTYTFTGPCGLSVSTNQTVMWRQLTFPSVSCVGVFELIITNNVSGMVNASDLVVTNFDDCGIIGTNLSQSIFTCAEQGDNMVTVTVSNACGEVAQCLVNVRVRPCGADILLIKSVLPGNVPATACGGLPVLQVAEGSPVTYCFEVENIGLVPLDNVILNDPLTSTFINLGTLAPGQLIVNTAMGVASNRIVNVADVTAEVTGTGFTFTDVSTAVVESVLCDYQIFCPTNITIDCATNAVTALTGIASAQVQCVKVDRNIPAQLWINEFHYDNIGADVGEFVELAGSANYNFNGHSLVIYNGFSGNIDTTIPINGSILDPDGCGFGVIEIVVPANSLGNGRSGIALVDAAGTVIEFVSYEGTFTATTGPANGMTSVDVGVQESATTTPVGASIHRIGTGFVGSDFSWATTMTDSRGAFNDMQTIICGSVPDDVVCATTSMLSFVDTVDTSMAADCAVNGGVVAIITREWRGTIDCADDIVCVQTITQVRSAPLTVTCLDITRPLDADGVAVVNLTELYADVSAPCSIVTGPTSNITYDCDDVGVHTVVVALADDCGFTATCTATVNIVDITPPTIVCPTNLSFGCNPSLASFPDPLAILTSAVDNCSIASFDLMFETTVTTVGCFAVETRSYEVGDSSGNRFACTQLISYVVDITPPDLTCIPSFIDLGCNPTQAEIDSQATDFLCITDDCGIVSNGFTSSRLPSTGCRESILRVFTAEDGCGNMATRNSIVSWFVDTNAPFLVECPLTVNMVSTNLAWNPRFEIQESTISSNQTPDMVDDWVGTPSIITVAENGITPRSGTNMLRFISTGPLPQIGETRASVIQYVDVTAFAADISTGTAVADLRAFFSRVVGDAATDTEFAVSITSHLGPVPTGPANGFNADSVMVTNAGVWEAGSTRLIIPPGTAWLEIEVAAIENVLDDPATPINEPEFDGHYADDVRLTITVPESDCDIPILDLGCGRPTDMELPPLISSTNFADTCGIASQNVAIVEFTNECVVTWTRTYEIFDNCDNTFITAQQAFWSIETNAPSLFNLPPDIARTCLRVEDIVPEIAVTATDFCGTASVTFEDGLFLLRPDFEIWLRIYTGTDRCGNSTSYTQTINIARDRPEAFEFISVPPNIEGCNLDTSVTNLGIAVAANNCEFLTVTNTDVVVVPDCPMVFDRIFSATIPGIGGGQISVTQRITNVVDTTPPILVIPPDLVACNAFDTNVSGVAMASDDCGIAAMNFSDNVIDTEACQITILRIWFVQDFCGQLVRGTQEITSVIDDTPPLLFAPTNTIACLPVDLSVLQPLAVTNDCTMSMISNTVNMSTDTLGRVTVERIWDVTDDCGNMASTNAFTLYYPPGLIVFTSFPSNQMTCSFAETNPFLNPQPTAESGCSPLSIDFDDTTMTTGCTQTIDRVWSAVDVFGNVLSATQTITVLNDSANPLIDPISLENITLCNTTNLPSPTAVDDCSDVTFSSIDTVRQLTCRQEITRFWVATDACGNRASGQQLVTLFTDTEAPTLELPPDYVGDCDDSIDPNQTRRPVVGDNCGVASITFTDRVVIVDCVTTITRTWTVEDGCGNANSGDQTITLTDDSPPVLRLPNDVFEVCMIDIDPSNTGLATATDNCGSAMVSFTDTEVETGCRTVIDREWVAVDSCGQESVRTQRIVMQDNNAPTLNCLQAITVIPNVAGQFVVPDLGTTLTAADNCGVTVVQTPPVGTVFASSFPASIQVNVTASDPCGNVTTCEVTLASPACIGDEVWDDTNANGVRDAGESPLSGVTVILYDDTGAEVNRVFTDPAGEYLFYVDTAANTATARGTAGRDYQVGFEFPDYIASPLGGQSTVDPFTARTPVFNLAPNAHDLSRDIGLYNPASIKGVVFQDLQNDGSIIGDNLQTLGLNGIDVNLFRILNGQRQLFSEFTTRTDATGNRGTYCFEDLPPGDYEVSIDASDLPDGLTQTTPLTFGIGLTSGPDVVNVDNLTNFGFTPAPTAVEIEAADATGGQLTWTVAMEDDTLGYNVIDTATGLAVNEALVLGTGPGSTYTVAVGEGTYTLQEVDNDLTTNDQGTFTHHAEVNASPEGEPTKVLNAVDGEIRFETEAGIRSYFVTGVPTSAKVLDITDPDTPVRLLVELINSSDGTAAYFSYPDGAILSIK